MITGFVDESGTPSSGNDETGVYTVALLLTHDLKGLDVTVRRLRRALGRRDRSSELKAARTESTVIRRLLSRIAQTDSEVYITVVDKTGLLSSQSEAAYQAAVARVVQSCVERHPEVQVFLDKRYTKRSQRQQLEQAVRETIVHVPGQLVLIEQVASWSMPGLQAVDFVAWAFQQKYANKDPWAAQIIADLVVSEETVRGIKIAALPGGR
jgi:hypothetical protein